MRQESEVMPAMTIKDYSLDVVSQFIYLGFSLSDKATFDTNLGKRIWKAATNMEKLTSREWENNKTKGEPISWAPHHLAVTIGSIKLECQNNTGLSDLYELISQNTTFYVLSI